nr:MAG TPA: SWIM zinc finger protein [Caudoviricetes sp.]
MEKIVKFLIQGSGKEPYRCTFWKVDDYDLHSACTCPAGKKGQYCKHRFALLEGDITNVVDYSEEDFKELQEMLKSSDIADFYDDFAKAKIGEKISKICFDTSLHLKLGETTAKTFEDIKKYIGSNTVILLMKKEAYFFDLNKNIKEQIKIDKDEVEKLGLFVLKDSFYTTSEYLVECFKFYKSINIKEYNQKMKEIMK